MKTPELYIACPLRTESSGDQLIPLKEPAIRKTFPFHDMIAFSHGMSTIDVPPLMVSYLSYLTHRWAMNQSSL